MFMAKTAEEAIKKAKGIRLYIETEIQYWIETEKGIVKILKPLPITYIREKLLNGEFPEKYINAIFNKQERKKTKALTEVLKINKSFILSGPAGIGKTYATIYKIAKLLREYKINAPLYITLQDFDVKKEQDIRRLKNYDCFLIDDLNPNINSWEKKFATEVIYHAYNQEKMLFITTNVSEEKLFTFLNEEPVISRILEMCEIKEIKKAEDLRVRR